MNNSAKAIPVTIGLDIAKNFFQVHAVDGAGQIVLRSADLMARTAMDCLYLGTAVLERMRNTEPQLAYAVMLAIARQLERNLRMANLAVLGTEG